VRLIGVTLLRNLGKKLSLKIGYLVLLVKMIKTEQNPVGERILLKELRLDAAQPVLPVKIIKDVEENQRKERLELFPQKKGKGFMGGLSGEDNYELARYIKN
jgi:hypothetical protein|tara:strand:- start:428 stop:733 length:306 start_codon:yes stop_codon:yes gene_type:complete